MSGLYTYARESFRKSRAQRSQAFKQRLMQWRLQPSVTRAEPTNPMRARSLGYKAKKEFVIARVRVAKGKRSRPAPALGRKPGKNVKRVSLAKSLRWLAEQKALRKHKNLSLIGSYFIGSDGVSEYYEVIMRDMHSRMPKRIKKR